MSPLFFSGINVYASDEVKSGQSVAATDESNMIKNEKWIELEKEVARLEIQDRANLNPEARAAYLLEKYDGAAITPPQAEGIGQRIQNGAGMFFTIQVMENKQHELNIMECMLHGVELLKPQVLTG